MNFVKIGNEEINGLSGCLIAVPILIFVGSIFLIVALILLIPVLIPILIGFLLGRIL